MGSGGVRNGLPEPPSSERGVFLGSRGWAARPRVRAGGMLRRCWQPVAGQGLVSSRCLLPVGWLVMVLRWGI